MCLPKEAEKRELKGAYPLPNHDPSLTIAIILIARRFRSVAYAILYSGASGRRSAILPHFARFRWRSSHKSLNERSAKVGKSRLCVHALNGGGKRRIRPLRPISRVPSAAS